MLFLEDCQGCVRNGVMSIGLSQKLSGNTMNYVLTEAITNTDS